MSVSSILQADGMNSSTVVSLHMGSQGLERPGFLPSCKEAAIASKLTWASEV